MFHECYSADTFWEAWMVLWVFAPFGETRWKIAEGLKWLSVCEILFGDCNPGESDAASHCHHIFTRDLIRNIIISGCSLIEFSMGFVRATPCIIEKPSRLALIELTSMVETWHTHRASQVFDHCSTKVDKVLSERLLICKELLESRNLRITRSKTGLAGWIVSEGVENEREEAWRIDSESSNGGIKRRIRKDPVRILGNMSKMPNLVPIFQHLDMNNTVNGPNTIMSMWLQGRSHVSVRSSRLQTLTKIK